MSFTNGTFYWNGFYSFTKATFYKRQKSDMQKREKF